MKRFRFAFFDSCHSKDDATAAAIPRSRDISFPPPPPLCRRRGPTAVSSSGCTFRRTSVRRNPALAADFAGDDLSLARETPTYLWRRDDNWHAVASTSASASPRRRKIDSGDGVLFPPAISMLEARRRKVEHATGSSDEEEDIMPGGEAWRETAAGWPSPEARGPRRLVACGGGSAVRESMAVVKRSEDPRGDFRRSMAEMVVEKGIYRAGDLEQLLQCFLSLNSHHHHVAIVAAFADVWEALFPASSGGGGY